LEKASEFNSLAFLFYLKIMNIGIPKEIKNLEFRVGLSPAGVHALQKEGHQIWIETNAGIGSGFTDEMYVHEGASILPTASEVYAAADLIVKVKEPLAAEYDLIKKGQIIFTYFHFAASRELTEAMLRSKAICFAYESVELADRTLPLLIPMSEVAGRMAVQVGAYYLGKPQGGKGKMLGGVPGVRPAHVLILGGGVVGTQAAKMAAGLGANVTIMDTNLSRLRYLDEVLPANVHTQFATSHAIQSHLPQVDLLIGAVLLHGSKAPQLIKKEDLRKMELGTVLVDVAVDQGGCIETCKPTTHENPVYEIDGILHYCVANMPGAVPQTSTLALTQATLPYIQLLANLGWQGASTSNEALNKGLTIYDGKLFHPGLAASFNL
jgi:alanine dehydrogenase